MCVLCIRLALILVVVTIRYVYIVILLPSLKESQLKQLLITKNARDHWKHNECASIIVFRQLY